jgi:hypothetical protein
LSTANHSAMAESELKGERMPETPIDAELRAQVQMLAGEVERLRQQVALAESRDPESTGSRNHELQSAALPIPGDETRRRGVAATDTTATVTRRGALRKFGTAAALGLGIAAGESLLSPKPASATTGSMAYGAFNDAGSSLTELTSADDQLTLEVQNSSSTGDGLFASVNNPETAILGQNLGTGIGVASFSVNGYGVQASGGLAPIFVVPAASSGPPSSGSHQVGELYTDSNGAVYKCMGSGSPGVWVPMNAVVPLQVPVRVVDTTKGTGGITGPIMSGHTYTTTSIVGSNGIPTGALGMVGNLTISGNGSLLNGYGVLNLFSTGLLVPPKTASLTSGAGCFAISNSVTVRFGTNTVGPHVPGLLSFSWGGGGPVPPCQVFLDVNAYIM